MGGPKDFDPQELRGITPNEGRARIEAVCEIAVREVRVDRQHVELSDLSTGGVLPDESVRGCCAEPVTSVSEGSWSGNPEGGQCIFGSELCSTLDPGGSVKPAGGSSGFAGRLGCAGTRGRQATGGPEMLKNDVNPPNVFSMMRLLIPFSRVRVMNWSTRLRDRLTPPPLAAMLPVRTPPRLM